MKTLETETTWTSNPMTHAGMSAEAYTAFLQAERQNQEADRLERTLTNIARRAETLFDDGYTLEQPYETGLLRFVTVKSPKGDCYSVRLNPTDPTNEAFGDDCTCPAHKKYGTCKHLLAVKFKEAEDAEADAAWERIDEAKCYGYSRFEGF